jgi:GNAT superfamily N-acetyltransferase
VTGRLETVRFDPQRQHTDEFTSGAPALDEWLRRYAGQGQRRDASRTFVVVDDLDHVVGYYTLLAGEVHHGDAPLEVRRGMPRHFPIPVCVLARLAVDRRHQGAGLGAALLADALDRAADAAEQVGMRAVIVDAIDEGAADFYEHFGFTRLVDEPLTLMVTVAHIRAAQSHAQADDDAVAERRGATPPIVPSDECWESRATWAEAFVLLGAHGLRPKLTSEALVVYRTNNSPVLVRAPDGDLPVYVFGATLVIGDPGQDVPPVQIADPVELVELVLERVGRPGPAAERGFVRWFLPADEAARLELAAAYATYRLELDAFASQGIHPYIERSQELHIYADIGTQLLVDVIIGDCGLPVVAPEIDDGEWVVYISNREGHEAEFTVDRTGDRVADADALAIAVREALSEILDGRPVFLERYDRRLGRLDPPRWLE